MSLKKSDYHFDLPDDLIATEPIRPRDHSRLMLVNRAKQSISLHKFHELAELLDESSVLALNNTGVLPARLPGQRASGGRIEALLVKAVKEGIWQCKVKNASKIKQGEILSFCNGELQAKVQAKDDQWVVLDFSQIQSIEEQIHTHGHAPLPPYILKLKQKIDQEEEKKRYRTIFAKDSGSIAAPTAGFHFTNNLFDRLKDKGIERVEITLQVGLGTFEPVRNEDLSQHKMHCESFDILVSAADAINRAKAAGRKVIAVGTTTTRALESATLKGKVVAGHAETEIFIHPPYQFKVVDQMITNFHLPGSTLLMMVCAFGGKGLILEAYRQAIAERFRFYSYGDAMLIL